MLRADLHTYNHVLLRAEQEALVFCPNCRQPRNARRKRPNHIVHALLTLATAGLWVVVWLVDAYGCPAWRCTVCRSNIEL